MEAGVVGIPDGQLSSAGFAGKPGDTHVHPDGKRTEVLIGIGDAADVDTDAVRRAAAAVGRRFGRYGKLGVELPETELDGVAARQALVEGVALSTYVHHLQVRSQASKLATVEVAGGTGAKNQAALDCGATIARGQMLARDFVNEPGGVLTPAVFARRAQAVAKEQVSPSRCGTRRRSRKGKLGGLLGVNRGSTQPPRFVELTYTPKSKPKGTLALIGKGITFDAGGLSIKTGAGMMTMKCDMGGAAAVIGAMSVLKDLGVGCRGHSSP